MPCAFCKKYIEKGEEFVLFGKYPSYWNLFTVWFWNQTSLFSPEEFGEIYHKDCFMKMVRKEIEEEKKEEKQSKKK
jgi:hypothetical protein